MTQVTNMAERIVALEDTTAKLKTALERALDLVAERGAEVKKLRREAKDREHFIRDLRNPRIMIAPDVLKNLDDLVEQATRERSHFYVAKIAKEAHACIEQQERVLQFLLELLGPTHPEGKISHDAAQYITMLRR